MKKYIKKIKSKLVYVKTNIFMYKLKRRMFRGNLSDKKVILLDKYSIKITDGPNYYIQFKDEFINKIYHFNSEIENPLIIDGGSNIGLSVLYFKNIYPASRIICFEPDPNIFSILSENISNNDIDGITLIPAGLSSKEGECTFIQDGTSGGKISDIDNTIKVNMTVLSNYLDERVDFLKLNIEGEELAVLQEATQSGKFRNIRELVIEYHGWANGPQYLGDILNLLVDNGYRYLVHDFDAETCSASKPPFNISSNKNWFCLVYAKRVD